tara:strand:- start:6036 stop:6203 length:168 start_codon:yes stop_codon:yes gene_type:complete
MKKTDKEKAQAFIEEIIEVSKRHGLTISHEDSQGLFEVNKYNNFDIEWLKDFTIR